VIRSFTTTALASALVAGTAAQAAQLSFTGNVDAGYMADLKTLEDAPVSGYNLEANLTVEAKFSDAVSVQLFATSLAGAVPATFADGIDETSATYVGRWPGFAFDGAAIVWKTGADETVTIGDIVYAKGSVGYYAAKRYSTVTRVAALRGASYAKGGLLAYAGADDAADTLFTAGASYLYAMDSLNSIEPSAIIHVGDAEDLPWSAGLQYKGKFGAVGLNASASVFGGNNFEGKNQIGYALAVEPSFTSDAFTVAGFAFFSPTGKDSTHTLFAYPMRHGRSYAAWAEDLTVYIEPGFGFAGGKAGFGLPIEYHEPNLDVEKNERISLVPSLYIYPEKDITITAWGESDFWTEDNKDVSFSVGLETVFKF